MKILPIFTFILALVFSQTDNQIKKAKKIIKEKGLSDTQVEKIAKSRGFSDDQINSVLQKRAIGKSESDISSPNLMSISNDNSLNEEEDNIIETTEDKSIPKKVITNKETGFSAHFGYNIFKRDPSIFQSSSVGVVDPNYLIGPGDEIIVMLWGETQFRQIFKVDREGFVFIPEIGQIFVNGLTLNLLESKLFRVFSQAYESLQPPGRDPTTFLDVSLGNLRPLRVQVLGEVSQPGYYTVSPSTTLFSSLYYFNGPTKLGSLRDIQLIRSGKKIATIDFYDFLLTGKKTNDQKLQLDDVIFIPNRLKTIRLEGEVNRPGIYEMKPKETLKDLLNLAANVKPTAYLGRAQIDRIVPFNQRKEIGEDRKLLDIELDKILDGSKTFELNDGDYIKIFSISELRTNVAYIGGSILRPGTYDIGDSLRVKDLIIKADSLLGDSYLERLDIVRLNPDGTEKLIDLDLNKIMKGDLDHNILLKPLDKVNVYSISNMNPKRYVKIRGHIKNPGNYLLRENMNLFDLVFISGGFIDSIYKKNTYLKRADLYRYNESRIQKKIISFNLDELLLEPSSGINLKLEPDDEVVVFARSIFENQDKIVIEGAVQNPGSYSYKFDHTLFDLILEAGGLITGKKLYKIEINSRQYNLTTGIYQTSKIYFMNENFYVYEDGNNPVYEDMSIKLNPGDNIKVRLYPRFQRQQLVSLEGAVKFPGNYEILHDEEKIINLIDRAGGFEKNAYIDAAFFKRDDQNIVLGLEKAMKKKNSAQNIVIQNNDRFIIPIKKNIFRIEGEVNSPGTYIFKEKYRILDAVSDAGGFTKDYDEESIYIKYANGVSKKYSRIFNNHKIKDGSVLYIGRKPEEEPFDATEYMKDLTAILANFAQAVSIVFISATR